MPPRRSAPKNIHTAHQTQPSSITQHTNNALAHSVYSVEYILWDVRALTRLRKYRVGGQARLLSCFPLAVTALAWRIQALFGTKASHMPAGHLPQALIPSSFPPTRIRSESLAATEDFPWSHRRMWRWRRQGSLSLFVRILFGSCWRDWKSSPSLFPPLKLSKSNLTDSFYTCNIIHPPKMNTFLKVRSALQAGMTLMGRA